MKKVKIINIVAIIIIIIIVYIDVRLDSWYSQNNLKFISESMKEQITDWLNIKPEYSNSLELISVKQESAGFSSHDKYCELIFKISKEEYEKNQLDYNQKFDWPEMTLKGKKECDNNYYMCILRYGIIVHDNEYYTLSYIINNANTYIRITNIIIFLIIILILIFIWYLNKVSIENNKNKLRRNMIIMSILISLIVFSLIIYILCNKKDNLSEYRENLSNLKNQSQSTTEATQIATEDVDMEMRERELDEKIKTILYGILHCSGEIEEEYNEENVNNIVEQMPIKNGIYISNKGQEKILNLINITTNSQYKVDKDGYLISNKNSNNEVGKKIEKLITGDKCIVLDYNVYYYCALGNDICTFNIEPSTYMEKFEGNNLIIMILNSNKFEEEYESKSDWINQIINNVL